MTNDKTNVAIGQRLIEARLEAGFEKMSHAAQEFGWTVATYSAHERGSRTAGKKQIEKYIKAFRARGSTATPQYVLFGGIRTKIDLPKNLEKKSLEKTSESKEIIAVRTYRNHARTLMDLWSNANQTQRLLAVKAAKAVLETEEVSGAPYKMATRKKRVRP